MRGNNRPRMTKRWYTRVYASLPWVYHPVYASLYMPPCIPCICLPVYASLYMPPWYTLYILGTPCTPWVHPEVHLCTERVARCYREAERGPGLSPEINYEGEGPIRTLSRRSVTVVIRARARARARSREIG